MRWLRDLWDWLDTWFAIEEIEHRARMRRWREEYDRGHRR